MAKIIPENKARQGRWGWHGLLILVVGLVLIFLVWGAVEFYGEKIDNGARIEQSGTAPAK